MTILNISSIMHPASVAVIDDGFDTNTLAAVVVRSLQTGGFKGKIYAVGPREENLPGILNCSDVEELPEAPELAVFAFWPRSAIPLLKKLGARGTKAILGMAHAYDKAEAQADEGLCSAILEAARSHLVRVAGPDSFGVIVPDAGLNVSISNNRVLKGNVAFISQSNSVSAAVLDWAISRGIGFSHVVSLGRMIDVDFGDMLDYLTNDASAQAILLHVESITHARKFMSAARLAARVKPVVVLKGRPYTEQTSRCNACYEPETGSDDVYDAAFRRAGMLRVHSIEELFNAIETLGIARTSMPLGKRLAILANGAGIGRLTADTLIGEGGCLAELSSDTILKLDSLLPSTGSHSNPVAVPLDAPADCYAASIDFLLEDKGVDAVLALNCPNAIVSGMETAHAVIQMLKKRSVRKPLRLLASWLGKDSAAEARRLFAQNRVPTYDTPNDAVRGFMQLVRFRQNQEILIQTPPTLRESFAPDTDTVRRIIERAIIEGRGRLAEAEVKHVLGAYQIPFGSAGDAVFESFAGMDVERQFGPAIWFGQSGKLSKLIRDRACAIPPLNMRLAKELMSRTEIGRFLQDCCSQSTCSDEIALILVKISQLVCDVDEIVEIRIDPLVIGPNNVWVADANIRIAEAKDPAGQRLAVRPYPKELEQAISLPDGQIMLLRPVLPEDGPAYNRLFERLSPDEIFMRFMSALRSLPRDLAVRLTQIDYDREMALVLVGQDKMGETELYGGVRIIAGPDKKQAEFAVLLRGDMVGMGLGPMLLRRIIDYAKSQNIQEIFGEVLSENRPILRLCQAFGFKAHRIPDDPGVQHVSLKLFA